LIEITSVVERDQPNLQRLKIPLGLEPNYCYWTWKITETFNLIFMEGLEKQFFIIALIISNLVAIVQLVAAIKWPNIARLSFFILFALASWTNWKTSQQTPEVYLSYADLTWSGFYRNFINGWFAEHIKLAVGFIAACQALIAISMLLKGWLFKAGCTGAIIFLICILPFGIGSGFPCTAIMALALVIMLKKYTNSFAWESHKPVTLIKQL
jgi:hypothetical protein